MVSPDDVFAHVFEKYFNGKRDNYTIKIIRHSGEA